MRPVASGIHRPVGRKVFGEAYKFPSLLWVTVASKLEAESYVGLIKLDRLERLETAVHHAGRRCESSDAGWSGAKS